MSLQAESLAPSDNHEASLNRLRVKEFRKGLRSVKEQFNFLPRFEDEVGVIKSIMQPGGSTLRYLDRLSDKAYKKDRSNEAAREEVQETVKGFQSKYDSAVSGIDQAQAIVLHLNDASGSFAQVLPVETWRADTEMVEALIGLSHFAEIHALADDEADEQDIAMPMPPSGLDDDEMVNKITDVLGAMTAKGVRSMAKAMENSEYARMHFWGDRLMESNRHAYGRTRTAEELSVIASRLLLY